MSDLRFKPNVNPGRPHPMLVSALAVAVDTFRTEGKDCVVTSICDGRHRWDSFHYSGMAVDLRSKHLAPDQKDRVLRKLRSRIGDGWDVILEARNDTNEHYHLEFDAGRPIREEYLAQLQENLRDQIDAEAP